MTSTPAGGDLRSRENLCVGRDAKDVHDHAATAPPPQRSPPKGSRNRSHSRGTVDPGGEATEYFFEYGTDTQHGQTTEKATLPANGGNQSVSATLEGLTPARNTTSGLSRKTTQGPAEGLDLASKRCLRRPKNLPRTPTPPTPTGGSPTATTSTRRLLGNQRPNLLPARCLGRSRCIHSARRSGAWVSGRVLGRF